jgi:hypothetical protein
MARTSTGWKESAMSNTAGDRNTRSEGVMNKQQAQVLGLDGGVMNTNLKQGMVAVIACLLIGAASGLSEANAQEGQRIRIRMGEQSVTATLNTSDAARDLAAMLPLSIRMRDHLRREKTGPVPRPLSERTVGSATYESGDLGYWRPGGNFVIFYKHDGLTIPQPGIVLLGKVDAGAGIFDIPGNVDVTVEAIN